MVVHRRVVDAEALAPEPGLHGADLRLRRGELLPELLRRQEVLVGGAFRIGYRLGGGCGLTGVLPSEVDPEADRVGRGSGAFEVGRGRPGWHAAGKGGLGGRCGAGRKGQAQKTDGRGDAKNPGSNTQKHSSTPLALTGLKPEVITNQEPT